MFNINESPFGSKPLIPGSARIVFVSDMFVEDYVGGAELTSEALIHSSPLEVYKLKSQNVSMETLKAGSDKFWIFGNFTQLNPELIPSIVANIKYSVLEYDYKFCRARSPEKHQQLTGAPCDCAEQMNGKLISAFYLGSMGIWWMSEKQKQVYGKIYPFLNDHQNAVLSSVFDPTTLAYIKSLRIKHQSTPKKGWLVLGSSSWIKGADAAKKWCLDNNKEMEVVWDVPYNELLEKLATAEGFVYLPPGGDTCPRMVIEAKLLGCKLELNDNVQHKDEEWFNTNNIQEIEDYLFSACATFWNGIKSMMEYKPTISGYTTVYNAITQKYPFEQCIKSMLEFCDEVCVIDGGSTDGTWERLAEIAFNEPKLVLNKVLRDWSSKRHPVFDGMQKAEARKMCTKEFCWQMDADEIVHEDDGSKIVELCRTLPKGAHVVCLPVIEYWGGSDKVRMDIQNWKWRLSRNLRGITHGIPAQLRRTDNEGNLYAAGGTDGCDMIDEQTGEPLPHLSYYTQEVDEARKAGLAGNEHARRNYEQWYNNVASNLPGVFHYSWYDLPRKIKLYRDYWQNHWAALWDKNTSDTPENNMFFDCAWSDVTDEMIVMKADDLKQIGGWIWHRKWDGTKTPWITCSRSQPKVML